MATDLRPPSSIHLLSKRELACSNSTSRLSRWRNQSEYLVKPVKRRARSILSRKSVRGSLPIHERLIRSYPLTVAGSVTSAKIGRKGGETSNLGRSLPSLSHQASGDTARNAELVFSRTGSTVNSAHPAPPSRSEDESSSGVDSVPEDGPSESARLSYPDSLPFSPNEFVRASRLVELEDGDTE